MAFRKRSIALAQMPRSEEVSANPPFPPSAVIITQPRPGVRPSPVDGRLTTSTGTPSLDTMLAGHSGLPLGTSILIGERGTTDYAGALLRFYGSQGVVHGHKVHVVGLSSAWGRDLPGMSDRDDRKKDGKERTEKMKIAWRYESLGRFETTRGSLVSRLSEKCLLTTPQTVRPRRQVTQTTKRPQCSAIPLTWQEDLHFLWVQP
jgi:elongator complex protein 4